MACRHGRWISGAVAAILVILTTHPIQYQVPLWQALARDGRVPFEVWYMSRHGVAPSADREFGATFAWDIDLLSGYPHRFLAGAERSRPGTFWGCRLHEPLARRLGVSGATALWIQGWQVAGYWQAAGLARSAGVELWLRGESNDRTATPLWKRPIKRLALGYLFGRVDRFLTIGKANRRLYRHYGVAEDRLFAAPYAVDNERFAAQAEAMRPQRAAMRRQWGVAEDAFCVLFCGKFIAKKRPMDLVRAAARLAAASVGQKLHLLFVGAGDLETELRAACDHGPLASFAGFLNQTEISRAYVAADCLVLPSDAAETWGLVVNEALASGLPCIVSDACGCAEDFAGTDAVAIFPLGDVAALAARIAAFANDKPTAAACTRALTGYSIADTVTTVVAVAGARS